MIAVLIAMFMTSPSKPSISSSNLITLPEKSTLNVSHNSVSLPLFPVAQTTRLFAQSKTLGVLFAHPIPPLDTEFKLNSTSINLKHKPRISPSVQTQWCP